MSGGDDVEISTVPRFTHDCDQCVFHCSIRCGEESWQPHDLYTCHCKDHPSYKGGLPRELVLRYGDKDHEYRAGTDEAAEAWSKKSELWNLAWSIVNEGDNN